MENVIFKKSLLAQYFRSYMETDIACLGSKVFPTEQFNVQSLNRFCKKNGL